MKRVSIKERIKWQGIAPILSGIAMFLFITWMSTTTESKYQGTLNEIRWIFSIFTWALIFFATTMGHHQTNKYFKKIETHEHIWMVSKSNYAKCAICEASGMVELPYVADKIIIYRDDWGNLTDAYKDQDKETEKYYKRMKV